MKHKVNFGLIGGIFVAVFALAFFILGFVGCAT